MDFRQVFDIKHLSDTELGHLQFIVNSPSYLNVFEPYLRRTRDGFNLLILDPSQDRKDKFPDDFLRGGIVVVDGFLNFFRHLIEETDMELISRSQQPLTEEQLYQHLKDEGKLQPVVGLKQEEISTDPEEDY